MWWLPVEDPLSEPFSPQKYFDKKNYSFVFDMIVFEGEIISVKFVGKDSTTERKPSIGHDERKIEIYW